MAWVAEGNDVDCGYEAFQPEHPIFAGLGDAFWVEHMDREEGGACSFWTRELQQTPLGWARLCSDEQQERRVAGVPLAAS